MLRLAIASLLSTWVATASTPLDGETLRRIFLHGLNTYLTETHPDVIIDHPYYEAFMSNGAYLRGSGPFYREGTYGVEGNRLCVEGEGIPKQCRKLIPQGGNLYLLVDVADGSKVVLALRQVK